MKIFALETNREKLMRSFLSEHEQVLMIVTFSAFLFVLKSVKYFLFTLIFIAIGVGVGYVGAPLLWSVLGPFVLWFFLVFYRWVTAFIDWKFDLLLITSEEVVVVDQSSLFHVKIQQMNLDNIASVSAESMYWNLFPFGKLHFDLKEGTGRTMDLSYIPHATVVASSISDATVRFQRRRAAMAGQAVAEAATEAVKEEKKQ